MTRLAKPGRIGTLEIGSRSVFPAMLMNFATDRGEVTERLVRFYRRLAEGGFGLIVTECIFPQFKGGIATRGLALYDDRFVPGFARLAAAVHAEGAKIGAQIFFDGAGRVFASDETVSIGPSDLTPWGGPYMKPMTAEDLDVMANDFAAAAARAVAAGADLIELHMGHGHLLGRFLSPYFNRREDELGGSTDARVRFPLLVLDRVRARVGSGVPITARLCMSERIEGGIELPEAISIGRKLRAAGIDAVHTSVGTGTTPQGLASIFPTSFSPEAPFAAWAGEFKRETGLTTIFAGKVTRPDTAERVLRDGISDFVSIGRAALADSDWPRKAVAGERIVPCIGCNQGCTDSLITRKEITCVVNPSIGFEAEMTAPNIAHSLRRADIVGGGVAGMVCALELADRGAQVTLHEGAGQLGGQYRYITKVPGKEQFGLYLEYLLERLSRSTVEVRTGATIDAAASGRAATDGLFWAAGATPRAWAAGGLRIPVLAGWECFESDLASEKKQNVLVVGAGQVGADAAIWLAEQGHRVTVVDKGNDPLAAFASRRYDYEAALRKRDVVLKWNIAAVGGEDRRVRLMQGDSENDVEFDAVVAAVGRVSRARPAFAAQALTIGDATRVGTVLDAIRQATFHGTFALADTTRKVA